MQPSVTRDSARSRELTDRIRFFVAGAPKAGTTALCQFLGQHAQIFMCPIKEPSFFAAHELLVKAEPSVRNVTIEQQIDDGSDRLVNALVLDWSSYQTLFEGVRNELAIGEGSMAYWSASSAPRAIRDRFPSARFVFLLRDPSERFFSQYLATRWSHPLRTCRDCIAMAHERRDEWGAVLDVGHYSTHLRRFLEFFRREQLCIYLYEDFCADPRAVCREIFSFLGVEADYPIDVSKRANEPLLPRWPLAHAVYKRIAQSYPLSNGVPKQWRAPLRRVFQKPRSREAMSSADRGTLIDYYREEILQTSELIGRDLSSWLR